MGEAGVQPWPKPFQNLRSTRETELADEYPIQVVTSWIGNSQIVARKNYLQVTESHFAKAAGTALQKRCILPPTSDSTSLHAASENATHRSS